MYKDCGSRWIADKGNGKYINPILFADYSDPDVIRVNDDFFMVASSFTYFPGMPVLHSKDLVNWKIVSYAVESLPFDCYDVPQHGKGIWAPSIRYHDGRFWVFFSTPDEGIFMANTTNPFGKWSDVTLVKQAKGWIDPCPFWDDDGQAYLVHAFARSRCGIKSILHLHKMSPDGSRLLDEGVKVFDGRINHPTMEGPKMYKRNGYYYILAPAGGVRVGWQTALRSRNVYGPYEHRVVMHQGDTPINGPHQGGLVELENGESWFLHFQDLNAYGRVAHLQPVSWSDDWPIIGIDNNNDKIGEPVLEYTKPDCGNNSGICTPDTSDDFISDKLGLQWQWQAKPKEGYYRFENGRLVLPAIGISADDKLLCNAPNLLSQLMQSPNFEVITKIKPDLKNDGDMAGITVTGGNYYCIRLERNGGNLYVKQAYYEYDKAVTPIENVTGCAKLKEIDEIYFKICVSWDGRMTFWYGYRGDDFARLGYVLNYNVSRKSWVGGRIGIFCTNTNLADSTGSARFEYVHFK